MTSEELKKIAPGAAKSKCDLYAPILTYEMKAAGIDTKIRQCHFIAQLLHESGSLNYVRELASGAAYEGRKDLGNVQPGDGTRYRGRGLIQITGRNNYKICGAALGIQAEEHPDLLEQPYNAVRSAIWFWNSKKLSLLADSDDFVAITKRINGGTNGIQDRNNFLIKAKQIL